MGTLIKWSSDPVLAEGFFSRRDRMVSNVAPNGAVSVNREWESGARPEFYIEQQRYGVDLILGGLVSGKPKFIDEGIRIIDWGFARQGPEGNFPGTGDPMHSTAFMVEASARAALLLREAGTSTQKAKAEEWVPKIHAAARWMSQPEEIARHRKVDLEPFTHRFYLRGAALAEAARLTGDADLMEVARGYLREGMAKQTPDGVNPERGGLDVSYQAVGVFYAQMAGLALEDAALERDLEKMMARAMEPVMAAVQPDGSIDVEGSTRAQETGRSGKPKRIAYRVIVPALIDYGQMTSDPRYTECAHRIGKFAWKTPHK